MRKSLLLVILLVLLSNVGVAQLERDVIYESKTIDMKIGINSKAKIKPTASSYVADSVDIDLILFPRVSEYQTVVSLAKNYESQVYTVLSSSEYGSKLRFVWDNPREEDLLFGVDSVVKVENRYAGIAKKINFPVDQDLFPEDVLRYTLPTENIDSDHKFIVRKASELVQGEDDYYKAITKVAHWVKENINYSLDTLTADAVQKPSWVLEHRKGVCDELTVLFAALVRSIGIPVKYVSGMAYTNWQSLNDWGPHAWAEVYFPLSKSSGIWVPYDITYGQFGYVDPTHIILRSTEDSDSTSTKYQWRGKDVELETEQLDINVEFLSNSGTLKQSVALEVEPVKKAIGFGSYGLIKGIVKNQLPVYTATEVYLAETKDIEIVSDKTKQVVLLPNEEKTFYWVIKTSEDLDGSFIYTFPAEIYTPLGYSAKSKYISKEQDPIYLKEDVDQLIDEPKVEEKEGGLYDFAIECSSEDETYYSDEEISISCEVSNTGNFNLDEINVCLKEDCKSVSLAISQKEELTFIFSFEGEDAGKKDAIIRGKHEKVSHAASAAYELLSRPSVSVKDLKYPRSIKFGELYEVEFLLEPSSTAYSAEMFLRQDVFRQTWELEDLEGPKKFTLSLNSNTLSLKPNKFELEVKYKDSQGKEYVTNEEFSIFLKEVTFGQKVKIFLSGIGRGISRLLGG
jgi:transglutaminase-like putative cysteine protease